jgi:hypothetical protein
MPDVDPDPFHHPRIPCVCCGYPTLPVWADRLDPVDSPEVGASCVLCDWENVPLLDDGTPDPEAASDEERNDGYTLAQAQANFARFTWMYDPARPEPWMAGSPPEEELALRRELKAAYDALHGLDEEQTEEHWKAIEAHEVALRDMAMRHAVATEEAALEEMEASPGEERPTDVAGRIDPTTIEDVRPPAS